MAVATALAISLKPECEYESCRAFALPLWTQLAHGYETCSVMAVPHSRDQWRSQHRTARKRADRAERLGYRGACIRREEYDEQIYEVNRSLPERQGRRMSRSYLERSHYLPLPEFPCPLHMIETYGVLSDRGILVAYLWMYRSGELALVSSILGHGEHLKNDVMYLLFQTAVVDQCLLGGYFVYNRADSGTDGLRFFKDRLGFEAVEVAWEP